jgi:hypothetical protein
MKRPRKTITALALALVLALTPVAAFAAEDATDYDGYEQVDEATDATDATDATADEATEEATDDATDEATEVATQDEPTEPATEDIVTTPEPIAADVTPFTWLNDLLTEFVGEVRQVTLTPEAMVYVLEDFDYLVAMILDVAPTQNIIERRVGIAAVDYFALWREIITLNFPVPSLLSIDVPELWDETRDDDLSLAADYLTTVLQVIAIELEGLSHFNPQPGFLVEQVFLAVAQTVHNGLELTEEEWDAILAEGITREEVDAYLDSIIRFHTLHYGIFSTPSVLWYYDIDPAEFDMTADLSEVLGFEDPDNIVTVIIEEDRIAYLRINSFLGNMAFDSETLFPFYEEIQDFEHLIIDVRGNGGGWVDYFPQLVFGMLVNEASDFFTYEFFMASEITEGFFINPTSMSGGVLYDIVPAAEFVAAGDFPKFNQADLEVLDYVIIRHAEMAPHDYGTPFAGEVWLLVDGGSASASENAAVLSMATGFATVVGEPTAGVTGVLYTFAALPNTGILFRIDIGYTIDQYGRSIEEFGVIPQIHNVPGFDALETVLALIAGVQLAPQVQPTPEAPAIPVSEGQLLLPPPPAASAAPAPAATEPASGFVPLRITAYAHGYTVEWDGANNAALVFDAEGNVRVVAISTAGTFNDNGTVFITVAYAAELFGEEEVTAE